MTELKESNRIPENAKSCRPSIIQYIRARIFLQIIHMKTSEFFWMSSATAEEKSVACLHKIINK